ncbi:hypothetical protein PHOSAC3_150233 [Mesotoga infera]|nr:hypothetical protein PHOSAC3_150233 [Mesotoga infera]
MSKREATRIDQRMYDDQLGVWRLSFREESSRRISLAKIRETMD